MNNNYKQALERIKNARNLKERFEHKSLATYMEFIATQALEEDNQIADISKKVEVQASAQIDVTNCEFHNWGICNAQRTCLKSNFCKDYPNCYYRQLQRANAAIKIMAKDYEPVETDNYIEMVMRRVDNGK